MSTKEEVLNQISKLLNENENMSFSVVANNGVNLTNLWVHKKDENIIVDVSSKLVEKDINNVYHHLCELQTESTRHFNTLDFDVEFARSIHPDFDPNWEQNLDNHLKGTN